MRAGIRTGETKGSPVTALIVGAMTRGSHKPELDERPSRNHQGIGRRKRKRTATVARRRADAFLGDVDGDVADCSGRQLIALRVKGARRGARRFRRGCEAATHLQPIARRGPIVTRPPTVRAVAEPRSLLAMCSSVKHSGVVRRQDDRGRVRIAKCSPHSHRPAIPPAKRATSSRRRSRVLPSTRGARSNSVPRCDAPLGVRNSTTRREDAQAFRGGGGRLESHATPNTSFAWGVLTGHDTAEMLLVSEGKRSRTAEAPRWNGLTSKSRVDR